MKMNADGRATGEVLIKFGAEMDRSYRDTLKKVSDDARGAQEKVTRSTSDLLNREERESARYHLARMRREKEYAAERAKNDRELVQRGTMMAREYDKQIQARERAEQRAVNASIAGQKRLAHEGQLAKRQMIMGGLQAARGLGELVLAHSGGGGEKMLRGLVGIQGAYDAIAGSDLISGALGTRVGRRFAAKAAGRTLSAGRGLAGALGMGLGTASAGPLAAAGIAAAVGTTVGGIGAFDFAGQVGQHGLMGGATPGSWTDTIAKGEVDLGSRLVGMLPSGIVNRLSKGWLGYTPAGGLARNYLSNQSLARAEARRKAIEGYKPVDDETARQIGISQFRDFTVGDIDRRLGASMDIAARHKTALGGARAGLNTIRSYIGGYGDMANRLEAGGDDEKAYALRVKILDLRRQEAVQARAVAQIEIQAAQQRLANEKGAQANRDAAVSGARSAAQRFGSLGIGERARVSALISAYKGSRNIDAFRPDDLSAVAEFGGKSIAEEIARKQEAAGLASNPGLAGDLESAKHVQALGNRRLAHEAGFNALGSPTGNRGTNTVNFAPAFNIQINAEKLLADTLDKLNSEVEKALKGLEELKGRILTKQAQTR